MNTKDVYYFAAQCLTLDEDPDFKEKIIDVFESGKIVFEDFIVTCDANLILPAIYIKFKSHQLFELIPESIRPILENVYDLNRKRNVQILQQIEEINNTFNKEKITPIYFKGAAHLLDGLYSDSTERMIGDIDLIVKEKDYTKAVELIFRLGYAKQPDRYHDGINPMHHPPLYRDDMPAVIEIHRTPVDFKYAKQYSTADVYKELKQIANKENCFVPSDEHQIIHNFIHSQLADQGYANKKNSLRDLYDLYLLSARIKPGRLINRVEKKNRFISHLQFAEKVFNTKERFCSDGFPPKKLHKFLCDYFMNHQRTGNIYRGILKTFRIFKYWYLDKVIKAFYRSEYRHYIFRRIFSLQWFKMHIERVKNYLKS